MFALVAFALLVGVRVFAKERAYAEACVITYLLVALSVLLKAADLAVPWVTTVVCFPIPRCRRSTARSWRTTATGLACSATYTRPTASIASERPSSVWLTW